MPGSTGDDTVIPKPDKPFGHFANVLNYLFVTRLKDEQGRKRPYKLREVAEGTGISIAYLSEARRGNIDDPHMNKVVALAKFFKVSPTIFLDEVDPFTATQLGETARAERDLQQTLLAPDMIQIVARMGSYSPVERSMVAEVMDTFVHQWRAMDAHRHSDAPPQEQQLGDGENG